MEADVGAGPAAPQTNSAEGDIDGNGAGKRCLEDKPPTESELQEAMLRIHDFFSMEGTAHQITDAIHAAYSRHPASSRSRRSAEASSRSRRSAELPTVSPSSPSHGYFFGTSIKQPGDGEKTQLLQAVDGSLSEPLHKLGMPLPPLGDTMPRNPSANRGDTRVPEAKVAELSSRTDAGGALGGILGLDVPPVPARSAELDEFRKQRAELDEFIQDLSTDTSEPIVPALPPRRAWRLEKAESERRLSDEEEVPYERNIGERKRVAKPDAIRTPLESGLSLSLRAAKASALERELNVAAMTASELDELGIREPTDRSASSTSKVGGAHIHSGYSPRPAISNHATPNALPPKEQSTGSSSGFLWKMRLGIPPTGTIDDRSMRYIHIPERGREQFQQFAKALKDQLSIECAESNPYVKALCAHRQEMQESTFDFSREAVDSLPSRLATERCDALTSMIVSEESLRYERQHCDLDCQKSQCEHRHRCDMLELHLPEMESRLRRRNGGARLPSPTVSTDRSTTAGSARSEPEARRVVIANATPHSSAGQEYHTLRLRIGRNRMELSEADRHDFLSALDDLPQSLRPVVSTPSNVSISKEQLSTCEGDISPNPQVEVE